MSTTPKNKKCLTNIYVLKDPETKEIRYVGKTINDVNFRLKQHIRDAKSNKKRNHILNWISMLLKNNTIPIVEIIEVVEWDKSQEREIYWISFYKKKTD